MLQVSLAFAVLGQLPVHDPTPGTQLAWEQRLDQVAGQPEALFAIELTPAIAVELTRLVPIEGTQTTDGGIRFRGLNRSDGSLAWSRSNLFGAPGQAGVDELPVSMARTPAGDLILVHGLDGAQWVLAAYDSATGVRQWLEPLPGTSSPNFIVNSASIDPAGTRITMLSFGGFSSPGEVRTHRLSDGALLWTRPFGTGTALEFTAVSRVAASADAVFFQGLLPGGFFEPEEVRLLRLDGATGATEFEASLSTIAGSLPGLVRVDPTGQRVAAAIVVSNDPFGGTVAFTDLVFVDAVTGPLVGTERISPGAPHDFKFNGAGTALLAVQVTSGAGVGTAFGIDAGNGDLLWTRGIAPPFGADKVGSLLLRMEPGGAAMIGAGRLGQWPIPANPGSSAYIERLDPLTGTLLDGDGLDAGINGGRLRAVEVDGAGSLVALDSRLDALDAPSVRLMARAASGATQWVDHPSNPGPAGQQLLALGASPDGSKLLALERVSNGSQVRALEAGTGLPLWSTPLELPSSAGLFSGFTGEIEFTPDGATAALLFSTSVSASSDQPAGRLVSLDAATGDVQWTFDLPDLAGYGSFAILRRALIFDAARGRWLIGGGNGEDFLAAIDTAGAQVWNRTLPTPGADAQSIFDTLADLQLATAADLLIATGSFDDPLDPGDLDPFASAFDPSDGSLVWSRTSGLSDDPQSGFPARETPDAISVDETLGQVGLVLHVGADNAFNLRARVLGLDLASGATLWEQSFPTGLTRLARTRVAAHALGGERLVIGGENRIDAGPRRLELVALDPAGQMVWTRSIDAGARLRMRDLVASADGTVLYVAASNAISDFESTGELRGSMVYAVDAVDGEVLWSDRWDQPFVDELPRYLALDDLELVGERLFAGGFGYLEPDAVSLSDLHLLAYDRPALTGDVAALPVGAGGTLELELRAGAAHGGETYLVLGSLTGTGGIPLAPGLVLPLTSDAWTTVTAQRPNTPVLVDTLGVLDTQGRGSSQLVIPAGIAAGFAGVTAYHAFLTIDATPAFGTVSNPVATLLAP